MLTPAVAGTEDFLSTSTTGIEEPEQLHVELPISNLTVKISTYSRVHSTSGRSSLSAPGQGSLGENVSNKALLGSARLKRDQAIR